MRTLKNIGLFAAACLLLVFAAPFIAVAMWFATAIVGVAIGIVSFLVSVITFIIPAAVAIFVILACWSVFRSLFLKGEN